MARSRSRSGPRAAETAAVAPRARGGLLARFEPALLVALALACLVPYVGKAFHIDDPLFVWIARQIAQHPLDPYGFRVNWYMQSLPMWEVMQNPPLASYLLAAAGTLFGWSEAALHLALLLPALGVVLGTWALARRLRAASAPAAALTLLTPAVLVAASSAMCDTLMLALWLWAVVLWLDGLEHERPLALAAAALLVAASALTKYFGAALVPLLAGYTLARERRVSAQLLWLALPLGALAGYEAWTHARYGVGLLSASFGYAGVTRAKHATTAVGRTLVALAFVGGGVPVALLFAPFLRARTRLVVAAGALLGALAGWALGEGWLGAGSVPVALLGHLSAQYAVMVAAGGAVLALTLDALWERRDAESALLVAWIAGTLVFAGFLNWTISARSVLPIAPAVGILLVRALADERGRVDVSARAWLGLPAVLAGLLALWVLAADAELADAGRRAAAIAATAPRAPGTALWIEGHWGFQYYLEQQGGSSLDFTQSQLHEGDVVVMPENNTNSPGLAKQAIANVRVVELPLRSHLATMSLVAGAGFYASDWGTLPYVVGEVPPERYRLLTVSRPPDAPAPARP